jgi:hypothetical protein
MYDILKFLKVLDIGVLKVYKILLIQVIIG